MKAQGEPEEKEKSGKKGCWIAVAIVILIIIAAAIGLMNYGGQDETGTILGSMEYSQLKG